MAAWCKKCGAAANKAYREANPEKCAESQMAYREANKEKISARQAIYRKANREKRKASKAAYYQANPERKKAHKAVTRAIKSGKLVRLPCSECGETKTEAHHYAYDMPLDVIWLCRKHHAQLHREHRGYEQLPQ